MECYNSSCLAPTTGTAPQTFAAALQFFAATQCLIPDNLIADPEVNDFNTYDIIIVGAGTAGSVLANRLSAIEEWNILLIEAGDDEPVEAKIPGMDKGMFRSKYDWNYITSNNGISNAANINGSINWPRGKMIGGSSNINAMIYIQGSDQDFQTWYDAGNEEWSVKEIRRCFKKAESFQDQKLLKNRRIARHYGSDGPLVVNTCNSTLRNITDRVLAAWDDIGIRNVDDLNVANLMGSGITRVTTANGVRQSHSRAYLYPILERKNLKIMKNCLVTKILIDDNGDIKEARGVEVQHGSDSIKIYASKEVIISAGAINSPQILMLSGIGPKEHLISKNISVIVDSPMVGKNLQDHCIIPVTIFSDGPSEPSKADKQFDTMKYLYNRTGSLAQISIGDILAFYSARRNAKSPDYQSHFSFMWKNSSTITEALTRRFRYKDEVANPLIRLNKEHALYMLLFNVLHPHSKGNISLSTNDPNDHPLIYPNYFSDPRDLESAATGLRILTQVLKTRPFREVGAFLGRMEWPACDGFELNSREYWKCVCLNMVLTVYHPVGTCMMGKDPQTSVVSSRLKVHGVDSLRVIDASIIPNITSGNTNAPVTAVGERGAELVLEDYNQVSS
ncbi:glucose dehydrogenase [FAD, quinone]-like [Trichoplusia ni]|uniref:Glucose dehydrogenase [FAD, quinone]-like n=1 Tax=Trichoplusia ni TaxID=7111 RepID=A0A7E5VA31_TRINI|nr:glucose dehydrogenase [FAD, quinone]-like [Trichoplusia ni]